MPNFPAPTKETLTARERWLAVLQRERPDRLPMDIWITPEASQNLCAWMGCDFEETVRRLRIDTPVNVSGRYVGPPPPEGHDIWGLRRRVVSHETGSYEEVVNAPLGGFETVEEIAANYRWPSPDHWDFSHLPGEVKGKEDRPIRGGGSEPFLLYKLLRGDEQALMDLVLNPEIVEYCLGRLFDLSYQLTLRLFETIPGKVMITYVAEDLGGQEALMYSPAHIRRFLFPGMKRMIELTKEHGSWVFHHSDGSIRKILPDLIDLGIQVLNPIQWRCAGMEREGLKRDFGSKVIFHGGVDNQQTLPFGTPEDVRNEVEENIRILGEGGGYILAPCHNIQDNTPPQNIVALYEAGWEFGALR
jgi:uroporphyrinogen decarboxylase